MKTQDIKSAVMTRSLLTITIGCALACLPCGQTSAQEVGPAGSGPTETPTEAATPAPTATPEAAPAAAETSKLSKKEMEFIKKAGAGNAAEVKAGELAGTNGDSQEVKDFGAKMVKDHGDANTDLEPIAKGAGMDFPPAPMEKQTMQYDKLSKLHGAAFDKAYVKDMAADHKADLAEYKKEKTEAKDTELKAYVDKTEKVVAEHLKMIEGIESKMMKK